MTQRIVAPATIQADARALPFRDGSFNVVFANPPWDNLGVLTQARPELVRVLGRRGKMILLLPHLDSPELCSIVVTNRDWTHQETLAGPAPRERIGPTYYSPHPAFIEDVLQRFTSPYWRLLDPFCGVGTIPQVARAMGMRAVGVDLYRATPTPVNPSPV